MKVVWFSHYKERGGWANASQRSILALDSVGVEVVPVNFQLTPEVADVPDRIKELEQGSTEDADYCVQNVLPHHMVGTDQYKKNVGFFVTENSTIAHTPWVAPLSQMDELWLPNTQNASRIANDLPTMKDKVHTVPYAFDQTEYEGVYNKIDLGPANALYTFYYIGDLNDRKNLEATIRCYHAAFLGNPNVTLVLKVGSFGKKEQEIAEQVQAMSSEVKQRLKIFNSPEHFANEVIIPDHVPRSVLLDMHNACDCYISTSHGEGWGIPIYDAFCMGNPVIAGDEGGPRDFLSDSPEMLVNGTLAPCTHRDAAFPFIGTGRELWFNTNEEEVINKMLYHYNNRISYRREGALVAQKYSYEAIGNQMKQRLQA